MQFASDNTSGTHPRILDALIRANDGHSASYGADALTARVTQHLREVFEAPEAAVYLVATGTACNALLLATLTQPWQTVFCTKVSHINEDECNAPEFFTGGAKLTLVADKAGLMSDDALRRAVAAEESRGVHGPQRGPVSITQATERGTVYSLDALAGLGRTADAFGLPLHMDGARFANALVSLGATAAAMTWQAGVSAVSFGGSKNGCLGVEAAVVFDPARAWEFELRRKRAGHLVSKHRYLAAQMDAYLDGDLWLDLARAANGKAAVLARGLRQIEGVKLAAEPAANIVFASWPRSEHRRMLEAGAKYYLWDGGLDGPDDEPVLARLVASWSTTEADVEAFLALLRAG